MQITHISDNFIRYVKSRIYSLPMHLHGWTSVVFVRTTQRFIRNLVNNYKD